jgi:AAA+ superfamily predicted ATPase
MCETLGLEFPEAACVALWLYRDSSVSSALTPEELLDHCRRLGKRSPEPVLGRLFVESGGNVSLHPAAVDFLYGREPRLPQGTKLVFPSLAEDFAQEIFEDAAALLEAHIADENSPPLLIMLRGAKGSGRKDLMVRICQKLGAALIKTDLRAPVESLLLTAELYGAVFCLEQAEPEQIAAFFDRAGFAFMAAREHQAIPALPGCAVFARDMPPMGAEECQSILKAALDGVPAEPDVIPSSLPRGLTRGQAARLAASLKAEGMATGKISRDTFTRVLREYPPEEVTGTESLRVSASMEDLIVPQELKLRLEELCGFIKERETVQEQWGFGDKIPWGQGISALFYGAPGTGKTLAAAILANEAGLPLMRADISQLVSKYIGETQKNIGRIFDGAAKQGCILFFDEADAIFARRTETADAQDKHANAETAYLLQRMEAHSGVCILATNLLQNFDDAFRRRIGYMLHFPMPDETLRERIWQGVFPEKAPLGELNFGLLARLELSGASIRGAAVHAAYLAASRERMIKMADILAGAKNEYAKQGKTISTQLAQMITLLEGEV